LAKSLQGIPLHFSVKEDKLVLAQECHPCEGRGGDIERFQCCYQRLINIVRRSLAVCGVTADKEDIYKYFNYFVFFVSEPAPEFTPAKAGEGRGGENICPPWADSLL
jgi:hypothetical protein